MNIEVKFTGYKSTHDGWHFQCGEYQLWEGSPSKPYVIAKLINGSYQEHENYKTLEEALEEMARKNWAK